MHLRDFRKHLKKKSRLCALCTKPGRNKADSPKHGNRRPEIKKRKPKKEKSEGPQTKVKVGNPKKEKAGDPKKA